MAFKILTLPQPLLQPGDLVDFRGGWPQPWRDRLFIVTQASQTVRDRQQGIIGDDDELVVDVDTDLGLNPERSEFLYQVRIGMNDFPGRMYVRWPSNDFALQLQDPNFGIAPGDTSAAQRQFIGFIDHTTSKLEQPTLLNPEPGLRFEFIWVKDQLPAFLIRGDTGGSNIFFKVNLRYLVNICALAEETDPDRLDAVRSGELLVTQAIHYSVLGRRGL